jgi:predicted nucleotide-binding protein
MVKRQTPTSEELPRPNLLIQRDEAKSKLDARIKAGSDLLNRGISNEQRLEEARAERNKWHDFNQELLGSIFSNEKFAKEYEKKSHRSVGFVSFGPTPLHEKIDDYQDSVKLKVTALESIVGRLELIPEPQSNAITSNTAQQASPTANNTAFVVHGRDDIAKLEVSAFLRDVGVRPIVLNDQPSKGQTIIEKLESYAGEASFAVVLLTPDDTGKAKNDKTEHARARQNVILEPGYFIGRLGRSNTCALYKREVQLPDFELPSDYNGVVYAPMDVNGGWKIQLAKELKAAGLKVDMNKLL